jgi:uncharacterized protein
LSAVESSGYSRIMTGHVTAIFRHPVKGFTPEPLQQVGLAPGEGFPFDRVWAVEQGPSGFDPAAPTHVPKQKFTVLMNLPKVAAARTRYDEASGLLHASAGGLTDFSGSMAAVQGREAFAAWVSDLVGEEARGPLKVIEAPRTHRFTDHPRGQVSVVNLASVRDLGERLGLRLDPLRFRANLYVDGWPAWIENDWTGRPVMLGDVEAQVFKPIVRCAATNVDPTTAERDLDITRALFDNYGHMFCGIYLTVTAPGVVRRGDACAVPSEAPAQAKIDA